MTDSTPFISLFAAPKPFRGSTAAIQDRAISSWLKLAPDCEVILVGDDEGVGDAARRHGTRYVEHIERNEFGTPLVDSIFTAAEREARGALLCYINGDMILTSDFLTAARAIPFHRFLMTGRRRDLEPDRVPDLSDPDWEARLRSEVVRAGYLQTPASVDYFVYTRGLFANMPAFALGRFYWDSWFSFAALMRGAELVDATPDVFAVHQNHGFEHHSGGRMAMWYGPEARHNLEILGGGDYIFSVTDATWVLRDGNLRRPPWTWARVRRTGQSYPILHPRTQPAFKVLRTLWRTRRLFARGPASPAVAESSAATTTAPERDGAAH